MDAKITKSANQSSYNAIAQKYEENYGNIPASNEYVEYLIQKFKNEDKTPNILDLGCGGGGILQQFESNFPKAQLMGVDFSSKLLEIAANKLKQTKLICEDFYTFNTNQKFDIVVATFSLIHLTDKELEQIIPKIYSFLNPNGYLYVSFILGEGEKMEPEALDLSQKTYFNFHTENYVDSLMKKNKFKTVLKKVFHWADEYENEDDLYLLLQK